MNRDELSAAAVAGEGAAVLECGDLAPLYRGDLSPSSRGVGDCVVGRLQLVPASACVRVRTRGAVRQRQVACAKAVTSHGSPKCGRVAGRICDSPFAIRNSGGAVFS